MQPDAVSSGPFPSRDGSPGTSSPPIIDLRDVVKDYRERRRVVSRARRASRSRSSPASWWRSSGKSGCGKSTLLNMITGIDRPTEGEITVAGLDLRRASENELARWRGRQVGVVFQFFQLIPTLTVAENVMLPMDFAGRGSPRERRRTGGRAPRARGDDATRRTSSRWRRRAGSSSGSRSPGRWPTTRRSSWPTSRPATSTPRRPPQVIALSRSSPTPARPSSWSPTT